MRALGTSLAVLWLIAFGLYVVAHDYPDRVENSLLLINERVGLSLPRTVSLYRYGALTTGMLAPPCLLLVLERFVRIRRQLEARLAANRAYVEQAHLVLQAIGQTQEAVIQSVNQLLAPAEATPIITQLEKKLADADQRLTLFEQNYAATSASRTERLRALSERLAAIKLRCDAAQRGADASLELVENAQNENDQIETAVNWLEADEEAASIDKLEKAAHDFQLRLDIIEQLNPRVVTVGAALAALQQRLEKANSAGDSSLSDLLESCNENEDNLGTTLDEIEGHDDFESIDKWEKELASLAVRVAAVETVASQVGQCKEGFAALTTRLEAANGDEKNTLNELLDDIVNDKDNIETSLTEIEQEDPEVKLEGLMEDITALRTRIENIEKAKERVLTAKKDMQTLGEKVSELQ